jgi:hypothetical protein
MKIKLEEAFKVISKYGAEEIPIIFLSNIYVRSGMNVLQLTQGMKFNKDNYEILKSADILEIEVIYTERLFAKLAINFPVDYRLPIGRKSVIDLDRIMDELESSNAASKRKRNVVSLSEIYKKNTNGVFETVLNFGEKINYKKWNEIKFNIPRGASIDYKYDECGIILFFILEDSDSKYLEKLSQFTELLVLIRESKKSGVSISPDFNPETDVFPVNERNKLLETYNEKRASLVIIGEDLNEDYKTGLSQLKFYDRYARMMLIKNIKSENKMETLNKIKTIYGQKLWKE